MRITGFKTILRSTVAVFSGLIAAAFGANSASANSDAYNAAKQVGTAEAYSSFVAANPGSEFVGAALCDLAEIDLNEAASSVRVVLDAGEDPTSSACVEEVGLTETGATRLIVV